MRLISKSKDAIFRMFLVIAVFSLASCGGDGFAPVQYIDITRVLFRPFAQGEYVFRNQADLQNALKAAPFTSKYPVGIG